MSFYSVLKKPFFGAYQKPWRWPKDADERAWERMEFDSETGARLVGLWGGSLNGPARGAILCVHPMVVEAKGYFLRFGQAELLRRAGYDVLLMDMNGFGESPSGSFLFPRDVHAGGKALAARSPGLPVGVFGLSMGAGYALCASAFEDAPFEAAFLEAPFTTLDEFWRAFSYPAYLLLRLMSVAAPKFAEELRPISRVRQARRLRNLMLIFGEKDRFTPPAMAERFVQACPPSVKVSVHVVPEAKHCLAQKIEGDAYGKRLLAFFDESLAAAPSRASSGS